MGDPNLTEPERDYVERIARDRQGVAGRGLFRVNFVFTLAAVFVVCGHTLAVAQSVPDLSRFDGETRQSIELACITQKSHGPVA